MSSRSTHVVVGALAGGSIALARARQQQTTNLLPEILGGISGGVVGARLPDILEPALHGRHRSAFHSLFAGGAIFTGDQAQAPTVPAWLRNQADQARQWRASAAADSNPIVEFIAWLVEFMLRLAAGFVSGVAAGYLSHLALDGLTPASLPLIA